MAKVVNRKNYIKGAIKMGRHGGGSHSGGGGGGHSSSHSGGSRSGGGGSSTRTSTTKPFYGCYNRSYYDRRGRLHTFYTSDEDFGKKSAWSVGLILPLVFITLHMCIMLCGFGSTMINVGGKVSGDKERIYVEDNADLLTDVEEKEILELLNRVYDASGMPVTVYTDDFTWKDYYSSLEVYSEELYYGIGFDEDAMIILFTAEDKNIDDFWDWEYDIYCGDDTVKCLSDDALDKLLDNFQKGMAGQSLAYALNYAWTSVIDDLAKTSIDPSGLPILIFILCFYGIFYFSFFCGTRKRNQAYKYFKKNPDKLSDKPMTLYSSCPNCGASNTGQSETCAYCGSLLKISDSKANFV